MTAREKKALEKMVNNVSQILDETYLYYSC